MPGRSRRSVAAIAAAVTACLAAAPVLAEETGFTPIPIIEGIRPLAAGSEAPPFKVKDLDGKEFDFSVERTKRPHLLIFWSIFCEPCREEMPIIEKLSAEHADGRLGVLAVNMDGEPFLDGIKGFVKQYKYSVRILLDELVEDAFKISDPYQIAGTPALYIIDAEGKVAATHLGRIAEGDLKALLAGVLGGN